MTPAQILVFEAIKAAPLGMTRAELLEQFPLSVDTLKEKLHALRDAGWIATTNVGGRRCRWTLPERVDEVRKLIGPSKWQAAKDAADPVHSERCRRGALLRYGKADTEQARKVERKAHGEWQTPTQAAATWFPA